MDRREAELRRRDREHARAAADVEQAAARKVEHELEAEPGRGVAAGAEGSTRVDQDCGHPGLRLLPRRSDPERADPHRSVERAPALFPALLDLGRAGAAERRPEPLLAGRVGVRGELDAARELGLLEPFREELEHDRPCPLGLGRRHGHRDAQETQRNALFSLSKNPSSDL